MPQYKSVVRLLESVEGNVLKLCLYSLQNKRVCTQELANYTQAPFCISAINFNSQCVVHRKNSFITRGILFLF
jgi:hypothetical protein